MEHRKNGGEYREKQIGSKRGLSSLGQEGGCRTFCSLGRFVPLDVLSLGTFCPCYVLSLGTFCPWNVISCDFLYVHRKSHHTVPLNLLGTLRS